MWLKLKTHFISNKTCVVKQTRNVRNNTAYYNSKCRFFPKFCHLNTVPWSMAHIVRKETTLALKKSGKGERGMKQAAAQHHIVVTDGVFFPLSISVIF